MIDRKSEHASYLLGLDDQLQAFGSTGHRRLEIGLAFKGQLNPRHFLSLHHFLPMCLCSKLVLDTQEAQIKAHLCQVGHYVGQRATGDDARGDSDAFAPPVQTLKLQDLVSQFYDSIAALLRLDTSVSGASMSSEGIPGIALACAYDIAVCARCLQQQRSLAIATCLLHNIFAVSFVNFLVGYAEETQLVERAISRGQQRLDRVDSGENTALHIAGTRTQDGIALDPQRPGCRSTNGVDGIGMSQQ